MNTYINSVILDWEKEIENICGNFEISFDKQTALFIGEIKSYLLGNTEIAFIKSNANYICRKEGIPDRAKDKFCFLILQYTGKMKITYQEHSIVLNEGDIVLLDSEETIEMHPQGLFSHISVHLLREKLYEQGISEDHFGKLITSNMSGHLLKCLLQNLSPANIELWYAKEDEHAFEDALIALIKPTINYKNIEKVDHLRLRAERFIVENLEQSNLNSQMVADYLGISIRHLFRLFEKQQQTVHQYIQMQRLEKVKYELKDIKNKSVSISDISMKYGFNDSAHFSKIFRKFVGMPPREYRLRD